MPNISNIKSSKKFTKKNYRAYNMTGDATNINEDKIVKISHNAIYKWQYKDRLKGDLGDIDALSNSIRDNGQQVPCVVRKVNDKYELIIGERRWLACKKLDIDLLCIVKDIDNRQASIIQAIENEKRQDLSDYSRGMSYANKISEGILTVKDLQESLAISKLDISRLLSFSKMDKDIYNSIKDFTNVSSRTAAEVNRMANKGEKYKDIIISLSDKISKGSIGARSLERMIENRLSPKKAKYNKVLKGKNIEIVQNNNNYQINFNSSTTRSMKDKVINLDKLLKLIDDYIDNEAS